MVQMQHRVVDLISKRPPERRDMDIQMVLPWLRKKSNLFKDLDSVVLKDVLRNCAYQKAYRDDVIITQGETGDSFYIMLTGRTSVYIDTQKSDDDPPPEVDLDVPEAEESEHESDESETQPKKEEQKGRKPLDRSKYGKFIIHYEEGKSFGEVALMSEDSVRNATVIADDETDLLVISRELFNRSMKAKQEAEYEERKQFIRRSPYFSNWTIKFKRLLEMSIHKEFFPFGTTIVRQGDPIGGMLFILSGQAKIIVNPALHKQQFSKLFDQVDPIEEEIKRERKKYVNREEQEYAQAQIRVRMREGYAAAEKRFRDREIELCCIEVNDVIGDVEMALELDTSISTVVCTANTTVMVLDSKNYDRLVSKKHLQTVNKICQKAHQKVRFRSKTAKGAHVPLLKRLQEKLREKLPKVQESKVIRQQVTELDKQKSVLMEQLVELFLKGKTPMIEPFVPNALYFRKKSAKRAEMIEHLKARKLGLQAGSTARRPLYEKPKHRVARSLKQLQNANAESELLGPYRGTERQVGNNYALTKSASFLQRPRTAYAPGHQPVRGDVDRNRPHTANGSRSRIFMTEYDHGNYESEMFEQMEMIQREKNETRSKIICSATAQADLDLRGMNGLGNISMLYDEDYFDWETSEGHLQSLEEKMKSFCQKIESKGYRDTEPRISSLRRFCIKDDRDEETHEIKVPKPGGTVFVKTRPCDIHNEADDDDEDHKHVRHFIITRDKSPEEPSLNARPKSAITPRSRESSTSTMRKRPKTANPRAISQAT